MNTFLKLLSKDTHFFFESEIVRILFFIPDQYIYFFFPATYFHDCLIFFLRKMFTVQGKKLALVKTCSVKLYLFFFFVVEWVLLVIYRGVS